MNAALEESLDLIAERAGDPTALVYRRLFARTPEMERLFVRDTDGSVKGHMLQEAIEVARDLSGARAYGANLIASEWVNHQNLGVPGETYALFYDAMIEAFREAGGDNWTEAMEAAWGDVRAEIAAIIAKAAG